MAICVKKKGRRFSICIGELKQRITVQIRTLTAPTNLNNDVDFDELFTTLRITRALIETTKGETAFDGSNIEQFVTHIFYIRFIADVTFVNWIEHKAIRYRIVDVENMDLRSQFYRIRTTIRGTETLPVNRI